MASKRAASAKVGPAGVTPPTQDPSSAAHAPSLAALLSVLDLSADPAAADLFTGRNMGGGRKRVYGGQVLAQAVIAACRTVEPARPMHSLHAYFLRPGVPENPVAYRVERVRGLLGEGAMHLAGLGMAGDIQGPTQSAVPFMFLMGDAVLSWLHLWMASTAAEASDRTAFHKNKIASARHFIVQAETRVVARLDALKANDRSVYEYAFEGE
jgi:hypothetical protein